MKISAIVIAFACCAMLGAGNKTSISRRVAPEESKTQPKEVTLDKDSQSDKYGEVPFNHENHATKTYSVDGKSAIACTECHHTDQPASALKPPLKTSERDVGLTTALLQSADSKAVKTCRTCHFQVGDDSEPIPTVAYPGKPAPTKTTNAVASQNNCTVYHHQAMATGPALKGKTQVSHDRSPWLKPAH